MRKKFATIFICFIIMFSQTPFATKLYDNRDVTMYKGDVSASVFNEYKNNEQDATLPVKILGVTIKNIKLIEDKCVYLGGQTVGIAMYTKGLLVTDIITIENDEGELITPGTLAGIKKGDYLLKANGIELDDVSNMDAILKASKGENINLTVSRNNKVFDTKITPVKNKKDGLFRLGLWMRDSAAGLGTITYIDPENKTFMALGHSICDSDTGQMLNVKDGRVVECIITGIKKGEKGKAGELKGTFGVNAEQLGTITNNTKFGIIGKNMSLNTETMITVASKEAIVEGKAYIYSDFETGTVKPYEIEIVHINDQTYPCEKSMVIKITDQELIEKTGGIVQGLSGSPLIQNGKLIGAVTHVLVNDPTRGYGIFIENMLETANQVAEEQAKKDAS